MGVRTLKQAESFKTIVEELKLTSEQLNDVLEYCTATILRTPELFPQTPGTKIHRIKIPKYDLTIWYGFNATTVELLEIEDEDLLN